MLGKKEGVSHKSQKALADCGAASLCFILYPSNHHAEEGPLDAAANGSAVYHRDFREGLAETHLGMRESVAVAPTKRGLQKKDSFDFSDSDSDSDSDASSIDMNDETVDESLKIGVAIGTGVQPCT